MTHEAYLNLLQSVITFFQHYQKHLTQRIQGLYSGAIAKTAFYAAEIAETEQQHITVILDKLNHLQLEAQTSNTKPTEDTLRKITNYLDRALDALSRETHNTSLAAIAIPVKVHQSQQALSQKLSLELQELLRIEALAPFRTQNTKTWHHPMHEEGIDYITLRLIPWLMRANAPEKQSLGQEELSELLAARRQRQTKTLTPTAIAKKDDLYYFPASFQPAFNAINENAIQWQEEAIREAIDLVELPEKKLRH